VGGVSIETLLRIDKIERYLRVLDPIGMTSKAEKFLNIDNEKQLDLLLTRQVTEFNKYVEQGMLIHLPFEELPECDLQNFRLSGSILFRANLSGANLSAAILSGANLSAAILSGADLSAASLSAADLSAADLSGAILSAADLSGADLSGANLSEANLSWAKFLNTVIINCKLSNAIIATYTDFSKAIIDDPDFPRHLHQKGVRNIPDEIKNKQELREKLLTRDFNRETIDYYLRLSQLPEI